MKKLLLMSIAVCFLATLSFGQSKFDNWPTMKEFHTILSQTFQPAQEGDLKPIRTRSHELLAHIRTVNLSPKPEECDNDVMKKSLKRLEKECDKLNTYLVRQEPNASVMRQLNIVHDAFHEIEGKCGKEEKKEK